jgi:hypothetical protein
VSEENKLKEEIQKLKGEVLDMIQRLEQAEIREKFLCKDKLAIQLDRDRLKDRNTTLEAIAKQDATIRRALLLLVGVMKHDVDHLHRMGSDESLPSEEFTTEALQVLEKIHGAFRLSELPLKLPQEPAETTGVIVKLVEPKQEAG